MSATIAVAIGRGKGVTGEAARLGTESAEAQANTFNTFTTSVIQANGSAHVTIARGPERESRNEFLTIDISPETDAHPQIVIKVGSGFERREFELRDGRSLEVWKLRASEAPTEVRRTADSALMAERYTRGT